MLLEKEAVVVDPGGISTAVANARMVAENYISDVQNGIKVHPEGDATTGWVITDVLEYIKSGVSHIKLWVENGFARLRLGKSNESHLELDYHSMQFIDNNGDTYFYVSDLRDSSGRINFRKYKIFKTGTGTADLPSVSLSEYSITSIISWSVMANNVDDTSNWQVTTGYVWIDGTLKEVIASIERNAVFTQDTNVVLTAVVVSSEVARAFTFGSRDANNNYNGFMSFSSGVGNAATGVCSHAVGKNSKALNDYAHSEGLTTTASGVYSHAEGLSTTASGDASHSEGDSTNATNESCHAEGESTTASGKYAHSEGYYTTASGEASHAQGKITTASGDYSFATGKNVNATADGQFVMGEYNATDANKAFIIGAGGARVKQNIFTVGWDGTVWTANTYTTSDLKKKEVIDNFDWKVDEFISGLSPIAYHAKGPDGKYGDRIHLGFGAQDVSKLSTELEMGDLGIYAAEVCDDEETSKYDGQEIDDEKLQWTLNYNEFIAPMVLEIQRLMNRVDELESQIAKITATNKEGDIKCQE